MEHIITFNLPVWDMEKVVVEKEINILQLDEAIIFLQFETKALFVILPFMQNFGSPQVVKLDPETVAKV